MNCHVCNSENIAKIGKPDLTHIDKSFIRQEYFVMQCTKCEFYFIHPEIDFTDKEWMELYNKEYFGEMTKWHKNERVDSIKKRLDHLFKLNKKEEINFLDVGCGEGYALLDSYNREWNTFGFDISDNRIESVQNKKIEFTLGSIFNVKYPDNFFDIIYMDSVLEHVPNPLNYLIELNRIMKTNGVLYIGVPNENSLFNDVRKLINHFKNIDASIKLRPFEQPYHIVGYTQKTLKEISEQSNFHLVELVNFAARYEYKKYKRFSKSYIQHLLILPIDILARVIRREVYYEAILRK